MVMRENQFYCVSDRKKVVCTKNSICVYKAKNPKRETWMLKGKCPKCKHAVYKIFSPTKVASMKKKYGTCR